MTHAVSSNRQRCISLSAELSKDVAAAQVWEAGLFECRAQGLGCMGMGIPSGVEGKKQKEALQVLDAASRFDGLMLDTADFYGYQTSEELICRTCSAVMS